MITVNTTKAFRKWLHKLKDPKGRVAVLRRIRRMEQGNFGDHKSVGSGVFEMRIKTGPGYRIYYSHRSDEIVLLLLGGDKASQKRDIETAKRMQATLSGEE